MEDKFGADFFKANRERLRNLFTGTAPIIITANGQLQRSTDNTFAFQQDGNFWYLTGIDEPDLVLVMDKAKEYLIVPTRSAAKVAFDGSVDYDQLAKRSGIEMIMDDVTGWKQLGTRLKRVKHVATLAPPPAYVNLFSFYTNPARASLVARLKTINNEIELLDLRQHMGIMRMVKQAPELDTIQQAIDLTIATLKPIIRKLPSYEYEYEIEAALTRGFRIKGSSGHAFDPIVAGGASACQIHNITNNAPLGKRELLLFDIGAELHHYAADISRTYAPDGATRRQQKIFEAVREAQDYAYEQLKPGVIMREYEKLIEQFMGEKLRSLGLIKNVERAEIRRYYPHATSHFLGLDVHDIGDYERPLEPGVVLTVEPGIYIPEEGIGVRIEDDVVITADGIDILSRKLPTEL